MTRLASLASWALCASTLLAVYGVNRPAQACGGTFCDAGPQQMPVDQTGENILFVMDGSTVEAHVQIQYQGDPESFAWVVPVMALPEISAGSDPLFQSLLDATVPTFSLSQRFDDCGGDEPNSGFGCMASDDFAAGLADSGGADTDGGLDDGFDPNDPTVVSQGVAGAFEYAVLDGGTVEGVVQWLDDNGYAQDDEAPELLADYLDKGFMFVAFKLRGGAGVDEIHPVVLRYQGTEPCVPIRLTKIAAKDDMGIRAFFLGDGRFVPTNYRAVDINPMRVDWVNLGANYEAVVTEAVDAEGSDGHGFVTEYAGASNVVVDLGLLDSRWSSSRFIDAVPQDVPGELEAQGLLLCSAGTCEATHPLITGILETYLPRPLGVSSGDFWANIDAYIDEIDEDAWSGEGFATDLEERIIAPGEHALDILASNPYLTRLYTTMSPHEMTADPLFHKTNSLPPVSNVIQATQVNTCDGPNYLEFADGSRLAIAGDGSLPMQMPAAARVAEIPLQGAEMTLVDSADDIDDLRQDWNAQQGLGGDDGGCACRSRRRSARGLGWSVLFLGMGLWARRRRKAG